MKVADLQQILANLGPLLETCGTKAASVAELRMVRDGLAPFSQLSLKDFAGFLAKAEAFSRGDVPVKPPRGGGAGGTGGGGGGRAGAKAAVKVDVNAVVQQVRALYNQAAAQSTTEEVIATQTAPLDQLSKDGLVVVAEAIELMGMKAKKKEEIAAAIRQRIRARRGMSQRVELLDRPAGPHAVPVGGVVGGMAGGQPAGAGVEPGVK
jgi:hypothetical protein